MRFFDMNFGALGNLENNSPAPEIELCDACGEEALIFQDEGNFCLACWQGRTEPEILLEQDA